MFLCYCIKRRWRRFLDIIYGYDNTAYQRNNKPETNDAGEKASAERVHFSSVTAETGWFFQEYKLSPEKRTNYCIPRYPRKYESYGILFETWQERDAFETKMESMEKIFEKELYDIKCQHERLRKDRLRGTFAERETNTNRKYSSNESNHNTTNTRPWMASLASEKDETDGFLPTNDDPIIEEIGLVNELQDVYELMCNLRKELMNVEKVLNIEIRERRLHPEHRLIHIKVGEDELSQQMTSDGGFRYTSSDNSIRQITYETLPPPLTLSSLLNNEEDERH